MATAALKIKGLDARQAHNLKLALKYAAAGIPVFPSLDKVPYVVGWQKLDSDMTKAEKAKRIAAKRAKFEAEHGKPFVGRIDVGCTLDPQKIERLWAKFPDATPSLSLGPAGLYVADCDIDDGRNGPESFRTWADAEGIDISACSQVRSQSGALHVYFKNIENDGSGRPPMFEKMFVQLKGTGGQTVAPGAIRKDGKSYDESPDHPNLIEAFVSGRLPPLPEKLCTIIRAHCRKTETSTNGEGVIAREIAASELEFETIIDPIKGFIDLDGLLAKDDQFAAAWRGDSSDASANLLHIVRGLRREYGADFTTAHVLPMVSNAPVAFGLTGSEAKVSGQNEASDRDIARCYLKAAAEFPDASKRLVTGDAFGPVDIEEIDKKTRRIDAWGVFEQMLDEIELGLVDGVELVGNTVAAMKDDGADDMAIEMARVAMTDILAATVEGRLPKVMIDRARQAVVEGVQVSERVASERKKNREGEISFNPKWDDDAVAEWSPPSYIVKGVIPEQGVMIGYGLSQSLKSFVTIDALSHIARGRDWLGNRVRRSGCVYWYGEGNNGVAKRFKGWAMRNDSAGGKVLLLDDVLDFHAMSLPTLRNYFRKAAAFHLQETGIALRVFVIDTLSKAAITMEEMNPQHVAAVLRKAELIAKELNLVIWFVSHTGKDVSRGIHGSYRLMSNTDVVLRFDKGKFWVEKSKDDAIEREFHYTATEMTVGVDADGEDIHTLLIDAKERGVAPGLAARLHGPKLSQTQQEFLGAFTKLAEMKAAAAGVQVDMVSVGVAEINAEMEAERIACNPNVKPRAESFARGLRDALVQAGLLKKIGRGEVALPSEDKTKHFSKVDDNDI